MYTDYGIFHSLCHYSGTQFIPIIPETGIIGKFSFQAFEFTQKIDVPFTLIGYNSNRI